jgi:hypothetical protein
MDVHLLEILDGLEDKLNGLLTSLTTSPTASGAPAAAVDLLEADDALSLTLETLRRHQANFVKILHLRAEAERLEDRVKEIVRDIEEVGKEINASCGDDDNDQIDNSSEDHESYGESDGYVGGKCGNKYQSGRRRNKEVDYRLLLEFARRISKYNQQAASDAAAGAQPVKQLHRQRVDGDEEMTSVSGGEEVQNDMGEGGEEDTDPAEGIASITKDATQWLDDSANMARQAYMIPYPSEDRIRMGVMGQLQLAAAERAIDPEVEAEKMVRDAEGWNAAPAYMFPDQRPNDHLVGEAATTAMHIGPAPVEGAPARTSGSAPASEPKITLDLDFCLPDDDDI